MSDYFSALLLRHAAGTQFATPGMFGGFEETQGSVSNSSQAPVFHTQTAPLAPARIASVAPSAVILPPAPPPPELGRVDTPDSLLSAADAQNARPAASMAPIARSSPLPGTHATEVTRAISRVTAPVAEPRSSVPPPPAPRPPAASRIEPAPPLSQSAAVPDHAAPDHAAPDHAAPDHAAPPASRRARIIDPLASPQDAPSPTATRAEAPRYAPPPAAALAPREPMTSVVDPRPPSLSVQPTATARVSPPPAAPRADGVAAMPDVIRDAVVPPTIPLHGTRTPDATPGRDSPAQVIMAVQSPEVASVPHALPPSVQAAAMRRVATTAPSIGTTAGTPTSTPVPPPAPRPRLAAIAQAADPALPPMLPSPPRIDPPGAAVAYRTSLAAASHPAALRQPITPLAPAEPNVTVSIERLELRPVAPARHPGSARPGQLRSGPRIGLSDYLRQRDGAS